MNVITIDRDDYFYVDIYYMAFSTFNTFKSINHLQKKTIGVAGTGGTLTQNGLYYTNVFCSTGTFTLSRNAVVNYLIVAGGARIVSY